MAIRVLLVDDHDLVRDGVERILSDEDDLDVVGAVSDGESAIAFALRGPVDVFVMDLGLPGLSGAETTRRVLVTRPEARVLALSGSTDANSIGEVLRAGASGFVAKMCSVTELANAIRTVHRGKHFLSSGLLDVVLSDYVRLLRNDPADEACELTRRQQEVLEQLARGGSTREIAQALGVTEKTIEWHRTQVLRKLGVRKIAAAITEATRRGLL